MKKASVLAAVFCFLPLSIMADAQPTAETVAPSTCKKPMMPSKVRKADDTSDFDQKFEDYQKCVKDYADAQGDLAKAHIAAGNAAVADLNAFVNQVNEANASK